jgi:hypothetical protein
MNLLNGEIQSARVSHPQQTCTKSERKIKAQRGERAARSPVLSRRLHRKNIARTLHCDPRALMGRRALPGIKSRGFPCYADGGVGLGFRTRFKVGRWWLPLWAPSASGRYLNRPWLGYARASAISFLPFAADGARLLFFLSSGARKRRGEKMGAGRDKSYPGARVVWKPGKAGQRVGPGPARHAGPPAGQARPIRHVGTEASLLRAWHAG